MQPIFFPNTQTLRQWFIDNHQTETELIVGYYKKGVDKQTITWSDSVDEAICFGWIDGVRKSIDEISYQIRFTPRKVTSIWSIVNIDKVERLKKQNLMFPSGIAAFEKRKEDKSIIYSFEQNVVELPSNFEELFRANPKAWDFFTKQAPSYQKTAIWKIISAKLEATKIRKLHQLITDSENERKIKELRWGK
ncbi:MAG: hypothetical protein RLZZ175_1312 [Bacteroidota bacterium]|jgi:uncharacterized protein YdeI (YjbR/CyaY-like superfamily)